MMTKTNPVNSEAYKIIDQIIKKTFPKPFRVPSNLAYFEEFLETLENQFLGKKSSATTKGRKELESQLKNLDKRILSKKSENNTSRFQERNHIEYYLLSKARIDVNNEFQEIILKHLISDLFDELCDPSTQKFKNDHRYAYDIVKLIINDRNSEEELRELLKIGKSNRQKCYRDYLLYCINKKLENAFNHSEVYSFSKLELLLLRFIRSKFRKGKNSPTWIEVAITRSEGKEYYKHLKKNGKKHSYIEESSIKELFSKKVKKSFKPIKAAKKNRPTEKEFMNLNLSDTYSALNTDEAIDLINLIDRSYSRYEKHEFPYIFLMLLSLFSGWPITNAKHVFFIEKISDIADLRKLNIPCLAIHLKRRTFYLINNPTFDHFESKPVELPLPTILFGYATEITETWNEISNNLNYRDFNNVLSKLNRIFKNGRFNKGNVENFFFSYSSKESGYLATCHLSFLKNEPITSYVYTNIDANDLRFLYISSIEKLGFNIVENYSYIYETYSVGSEKSMSPNILGKLIKKLASECSILKNSSSDLQTDDHIRVLFNHFNDLHFASFAVSTGLRPVIGGSGLKYNLFPENNFCILSDKASNQSDVSIRGLSDIAVKALENQQNLLQFLKKFLDGYSKTENSKLTQSLSSLINDDNSNYSFFFHLDKNWKPIKLQSNLLQILLKKYLNVDLAPNCHRHCIASWSFSQNYSLLETATVLGHEVIKSGIVSEQSNLSIKSVSNNLKIILNDFFRAMGIEDSFSLPSIPCQEDLFLSNTAIKNLQEKACGEIPISSDISRKSSREKLSSLVKRERKRIIEALNLPDFPVIYEKYVNEVEEIVDSMEYAETVKYKIIASVIDELRSYCRKHGGDYEALMKYKARSRLCMRTSTIDLSFGIKINSRFQAEECFIEFKDKQSELTGELALTFFILESALYRGNSHIELDVVQSSIMVYLENEKNTNLMAVGRVNENLKYWSIVESDLLLFQFIDRQHPVNMEEVHRLIKEATGFSYKHLIDICANFSLLENSGFEVTRRFFGRGCDFNSSENILPESTNRIGGLSWNYLNQKIANDFEDDNFGNLGKNTVRFIKELSEISRSKDENLDWKIIYEKISENLSSSKSKFISAIKAQIPEIGFTIKYDYFSSRQLLINSSHCLFEYPVSNGKNVKNDVGILLQAFDRVSESIRFDLQFFEWCESIVTHKSGTKAKEYSTISFYIRYGLYYFCNVFKNNFLDEKSISNSINSTFSNLNSENASQLKKVAKSISKYLTYKERKDSNFFVDNLHKSTSKKPKRVTTYLPSRVPIKGHYSHTYKLLLNKVLECGIRSEEVNFVDFFLSKSSRKIYLKVEHKSNEKLKTRWSNRIIPLITSDEEYDVLLNSLFCASSSDNHSNINSKSLLLKELGNASSDLLSDELLIRNYRHRSITFKYLKIESKKLTDLNYFWQICRHAGHVSPTRMLDYYVNYSVPFNLTQFEPPSITYYLSLAKDEKILDRYIDINEHELSKHDIENLIFQSEFWKTLDLN